jgi:HD superfamily phosphohydrolase
VDVHAAWVDACDAVREQAEKERVERQQKALKQKDKLMRQQLHQHKFKPQQSVKKQQQQQPTAHIYIDLKSPLDSDGLDYLFS